MNKEQLKYRYPGAQPFTTQQRQIFFGRTKDIENLYQLLSLEDLVVLYSKSGLGKSSLINAGVIPKIHLEEDFKPFSIRFGAYTKEQEKKPVITTSQQLSLNNESKIYLDKLIPKDNSFWYFIKDKQLQEKNKNKGYLLIFDQFEELFTYPEEEILKFKKELKEILNNQIPQRFREALEKQFEEDNLELTEEELELFHKEVDIKVLLAIRSDRMSLLNELKDYLPNILRHCYELDALSVEQAEDAILNPAFRKDKTFISPTFDFDDNVLDAILQFLTKNYTQKIESFQLQILCQNIEKKIIDKKLQIVTVADIGDIESIYKNHYDNLIGGIGVEEEQLAARKLIEEGLIFEEEERRLSLYEGQIFKSFGVTPDLLKRLVDSHLLRAEPSMQGGYTYELCHDTLVAPVLDAKKKRIEAEERIKAKEEQERKRKDAEEERKREEERRLLAVERKGKRRARILAVIASLFGIGAIILSFWAIKLMQTARDSEIMAREQSHIAIEQKAFAQKAEQEAYQAFKEAQLQKNIADSLRVVSEGKLNLISKQYKEISRQKKIAEENLILAKKNEQEALLALEEAKRLKAENIQTSTADSTYVPEKDLPANINLEPQMVFVKGGPFVMGCTTQEDCLDDEKPARTVTVSDFSIGKYEVTQEEWVEVMGNSPSYFSDCTRCPVENVSWLDVQSYINRLNEVTGKKYRLPTEAEWEYTARGGNYSKGYKYSGSNGLESIAWNGENSNEKTHPVGSKSPNELGIYDLSGNVYEWCSDYYGDYANGAMNNPKGLESGSFKVVRGGSWFDNSVNTSRVSYRGYNQPSSRSRDVGFRLALDYTNDSSLSEQIQSGKEFCFYFNRSIGNFRASTQYCGYWKNNQFTIRGYNIRRRGPKEVSYPDNGKFPKDGYVNLWGAIFKFDESGNLLDNSTGKKVGTIWVFPQTCNDYSPATWVSKKFSYQERANGSCEGFIKDEKSASKFVEVVSFTYGKFTYDSNKAETIHLQPPKNFNKQLYIEAKGIPFDLSYRMNAVISNSEVLYWNTDEVLLHFERTKFYENIGVTGYLENSVFNDKNYVPLRIVDNESNEYLFFIIRSNGSLRNTKWKTNTDTNWQSESGIYEKGDPIQLVFKYESKITEIEFQGINNEGELIIEKFMVKLQ